jgi:GDP/UDP-N,N'-diacetylbacillosamine 2-epimerase (hydrolysing)
MKRKIIAVTGARSEYDILYPVLLELEKNSEIELTLIVTGAHLSNKFGFTVDLIEADGFKICEKVYNLIDSNERIGRILSLGNQISSFANCFNRVKPDIVIVVGDREEAISVSMTCAYMDIACAHLAGGDIAKDGNIDNSVRYAASKFAHIHFTLLNEHKTTLLKLGEDDWRIHNVGNPALDRFLSCPIKNLNEISEDLGIQLKRRDFNVLIQHPIITSVEEESNNIIETLEAIVESKTTTLINYPNSDAGNFSIIEAIEKYSLLYPFIFTFKNLDRVTYINLLRNAKVLLGNSSSGIIEAPSIGLPVINIGPRQRGRIHSENVIFVDNNKDEIINALKKITQDEAIYDRLIKIKNPYGDGYSGLKIANILASIELNNNLIYKNITY